MRVTFNGDVCYNTIRSKDHKGFTITRDEKTGRLTRVAGYAIVFNSESESWGQDSAGRDIREIIAPNALDECLKGNPDIRLLADHDSGKVLGRTVAGTLRFKVDDYGVYFEGDLPDTQAGRDTGISIERGDIDACSFGFRMDYDMIDKRTSDDKVLWVINKIDIVREFSIVAFPAYPATSVALRSLPFYDKVAKLDEYAEVEKRQQTLSLKTRLEIHKAIANNYV